MAYLRALVHYLQTEKGQHDVLDYLRAIMIMAAVMAVIRIGFGIIRNL